MRDSRLLVMLVGVLMLLPATSAGTPPSIDDACAELDDAWDCAQKIERREVPMSGMNAIRDGSTLSIRLNDGRIVSFQDADDELGPLYRFRECDRKSGKCVVHKQLLRSVEYVVVDLESGVSLEYGRIPRFSPDGSMFIECGSWGLVGSRMLEVRRSSTGLILHALAYHDLQRLAAEVEECAPPTEISRHRPASVTAGAARWLDEDTISFELNCRTPVGDWEQVPYLLVNQDGAWVSLR